MAWIRDTDEKAQRRPADIALLVVAGILAVLTGLWAQTQSSVNVNLFNTLNSLSGNTVGLAKGVYALGSIWAALAVTVVLLATRQVRVAWHGALAAEIRHRHDRSAAGLLHQRLGRARARDERVGADVDRLPKAIARRVGEPAFEILGVREVAPQAHNGVRPKKRRRV